MNEIQGTKPAGQQWNRLLDAVVAILKYKKSIIDHAIYIKVLSDVTVSCLTVSTNDVINTTTNYTEFPELSICLKKLLRLKSSKDLSLSTYIPEFSSLILVSMLIILITSLN